ncbi:MAG TPA: HAMP domain-containing sensor histidine kinase [Steroidobacteraceae bacterium]|nr:HAMP domain-containing sensor histidine kinase [Steroidobacteraceae bacterium]
MPLAVAPTAPTDLAWRVIGLVNLYRLLVPPSLYVLFAFAGPTSTLGGQRPELFLWICVVYFAAGVAIVIGGRRLLPNLRATTFVHAMVDAIAISLLMFASGGVASGLGILFVVPVGAMALLADNRDSFVLAAIATLALFAQQIGGHVTGTANSVDYPATGILGGIVFLVALLAWPIARRLRDSEATVRRQQVDLANLAQLSQYIVQHLRESIVVVDHENRIRLINETAAQLLGDRSAYPDALLGEASPQLLYLLETWRARTATSVAPAATFVAADGGHVIQPHFASLGGAEPSPVIVFLEDTELLAVKIQQSKLAGLGRLSASIAHEIRNPVGAMSHAAQLLAESASLTDEDKRLTEIVRTNGDRVRQIIENVMSMARRENSRPERVVLATWLAGFRDEFCATMQIEPTRLAISALLGDVEVHVDPSQLRQIVWNLCENAVKYGATDAENNSIELRVGRLASTARPFLEVADRGPGIAVQHRERIFEPFFTGNERGTGLGLFLARELAQTNGATLLYEPRTSGGSLFRIVFRDPERWVA